MAYATHKLGVKCTIAVPCTTPQHLKDGIVEFGSNLVERGEVTELLNFNISTIAMVKWQCNTATYFMNALLLYA